MLILRPAAAVECPGREAKGRRDVSERFPTAGQAGTSGKISERNAKNRLRPTAAADPLPELVEGRFRLLSACAARDGQHDPQLFARRVDEAKRRARRFDEEIIRTVATSTSGLLAQLRLLSAFYEESTNGAGRRGSLLIQTIAAGIQRLRVSELPNPRPARGPPVDADRPPRELRAVARKGGLAYERHPPQ
jgi:hypothetical protein